MLEHHTSTSKVGLHLDINKASGKNSRTIPGRSHAVSPLHLKLGALITTAPGRYVAPIKEGVAPNVESPVLAPCSIYTRLVLLVSSLEQ